VTSLCVVLCLPYCAVHCTGGPDVIELDFLLSTTVCSGKKLLPWWTGGIVGQYEKFVMKNVKFRHIIKVGNFAYCKFRIVCTEKNIMARKENLLLIRA